MLQHTAPYEKFYPTMATDLTGLAQTIAELLLPGVTWMTPHKQWFGEKKKYRTWFIRKNYCKSESGKQLPWKERISTVNEISKALDVTDRDKAQGWAVGQIFDLVFKLFKKEQDYMKACQWINKNRVEEVACAATEVYGTYDASWVAKKLRKIRLAITEKPVYNSLTSSTKRLSSQNLAAAGSA